MLGVTQQAVSAWENEENEKGRTPDAAMRFKIGGLLPYRECLLFWEEAGIDIDRMQTVAEALLQERGAAPVRGEIVRVAPWPDRAVGASGSADEADKKLLALPGDRVPRPLATRYFVLDRDSAGSTFAAGDTVVVDTSATDTASLWGKVVLVDLNPRHREAGTYYRQTWPEGLLMGRLHYRKWNGDGLTWCAEISPLHEQHEGPGAPSVVIGSWTHKTDAKPDARKAARDKARSLAPAELRAAPGCRILGRMVAWFSAENRPESK